MVVVGLVVLGLCVVEVLVFCLFVLVLEVFTLTGEAVVVLFVGTGVAGILNTDAFLCDTGEDIVVLDVLPIRLLGVDIVPCRNGTVKEAADKPKPINNTTLMMVNLFLKGDFTVFCGIFASIFFTNI